jgi:D-alanyl-D-alanine dipeptidase
MRRLIFLLFIACSAVAQNKYDPTVHPSPVKSDCQQLIVVTTKGWTNVEAQVQRFERQGTNKWKRIGLPIAAVVGHNGLKWASVWDYPYNLDGQIDLKHEGDGCSPAGVLHLPMAFGYAPPKEARWIKLPYVQCTDAIECVDDVKSSHYNQVLDSGKTQKRDWNSSEQMHRKDVLYRWGVVVDHNTERKAGDGSCIFLHIWESPHKGTTGCTAMDERDLKRVMAWLDPKAKPLLVQFPENEYSQLQKLWQLPMIRP